MATPAPSFKEKLLLELRQTGSLRIIALITDAMLSSKANRYRARRSGLSDHRDGLSVFRRGSHRAVGSRRPPSLGLRSGCSTHRLCGASDQESRPELFAVSARRGGRSIDRRAFLRCRATCSQLRPSPSPARVKFEAAGKKSPGLEAEGVASALKPHMQWQWLPRRGRRVSSQR
jgi:hypothetical protein